jgi:hypothetical protein
VSDFARRLIEGDDRGEARTDFGRRLDWERFGGQWVKWVGATFQCGSDVCVSQE